MAYSDKNIIITPNKGSTIADPQITFTGANDEVDKSIILTITPEQEGTLDFATAESSLMKISANTEGNVVQVTGRMVAGSFVGNGAGLTAITGANVTGTVANATYATSAGSATSATTAATVTSNAQSNITSVGTLTSLSVTGNTTSGNFVGTLANGTSNISIPVQNGNINLYSAGNIWLSAGNGEREFLFNNSLMVFYSTGTLNGRIGGEAGTFSVDAHGTNAAPSNLTLATVFQGNIRFVTNTNERMRILATGNVGIGTSTPTSNLHVIGTANITGNLVAGNVNGGGVRSTSSTTVPTSPTVGDIWYNTLTNVIYRYTNDGTSNYWIDLYGPSIADSSDGNFVTVDGTQTLTNKTLTNPTITNYTESVVAIGTVTTAHTLNLTNGTVQTATLTASTACTFTMPTAVTGKSFILYLKQAAATGNGTATFTSVKYPTAGAPTITPTAGKMDILSFVSDGTNWYGSYVQGYTP